MNNPNFDLDLCSIDIEFTFEKDCKNAFPRKPEDIETFYVDFAIYNLPNPKFQTKYLSMKFDTVDYNCLSKAQSTQVTNSSVLFNLKRLL
jgi:hypothetical protein